MAEFTGERLVPGQVEPDLYNEHVSRYHFASSLLRGQTMLDAGCGMGYGTACLAASSPLVVGVDQDLPSIRNAAQQYPASNVCFLPANVEDLPFATHSFDSAVSFEVIEHLKDPKVLLTSLRRVTRPSGLVVLSTPNRDVYRLSRGDAGPNPFHHHEFTLHEFEDLLRSYFPHVRMFAQNHAPTVTFHQSRSSSTASVLAASDANEDLTTAQFFLAVCSGAPLPELGNVVYMASGGNVLFEREAHIRLLMDELRLKTTWLNAAQSSLQALHRAHTELQNEHDERSKWALETVERLESTNRDLARNLSEKCDELQATVDRLNSAEQTIVERTGWARGLEAELKATQERVLQLQQQHQEALNRAQHLRDTLSAVEGPHRQLLIDFAQVKAEYASVVKNLAAVAKLELSQSALSANGSSDAKNHLDQELGQVRSLLEDLNTAVRKYRHHSVEHELARNSRWVRIGRKLGIGPRFTDGPDPS